MSIDFRTLSNNDAHYLRVIELYKSAFPQAQHIPTWLLRYTLRKGKQGFSVLYAEDTWVGLMYVVEYKDIIFVQLLAIPKPLRSGGYGSKAMAALTGKHADKRIVLNIEELDHQASNYHQRVKRKDFYEKNGFNSTGYLVKEPAEQLEMLIYGGSINKQEIEAMYKSLFGGFLGLFIKPKVTLIDEK